MSIVQPLASLVLTTDHSEEEGVTLYDVSDAGEVYPLVSVIVSNTTSSAGSAYVWFESTSLTEKAIIAYNLGISGYNTYETFRFSMDPDAVLYVAGTAGLAFYVNGLLQTTV